MLISSSIPIPIAFHYPFNQLIFKEIESLTVWMPSVLFYFQQQLISLLYRYKINSTQSQYDNASLIPSTCKCLNGLSYAYMQSWLFGSWFVKVDFDSGTNFLDSHDGCRSYFKLISCCLEFGENYDMNLSI